MKEAILRRYDINTETYRQRLRGASMKSGETTRELRVRLEDLAKKWTKDCDTVEKIRDRIVLEQFVNTLPSNVKVWVQEHKPETSEVAAKLADDYLQARKTTISEEKKGKPLSQLTCHKCKQKGHKARNCPGAEENSTPIAKSERPRRDLKDITCFTCDRKGHYAANCPNLLCVERRSNYRGETELIEHMVSPKQGIFHAGKVEGQTVSDVCLDTGCTRTMVRQDLVPPEKLLEGDSIAICCAHGDTVVYPLARVEVEVDGQAHEVEAAVSTKLPMSMLMGTDVPALPALVTAKLGEVETAHAVMTRAQKKAQESEEASDRLREKESEVHPRNLTESQEEVRLPAFHGDLFVAGKERVKLTRNQKRAQQQEHRQSLGVEATIEKHGLEMSAQELRDLQMKDVTLEEVRKAADEKPAKVGFGFFRKNGLLYRRWVPRGRPESKAVEQLVLPVQCRAEVVKLAHRPPFSGHLGRDKTANRLQQRFYWPTLFADVAKAVRTCVRVRLRKGRSGLP